MTKDNLNKKAIKPFCKIYKVCIVIYISIICVSPLSFFLYDLKMFITILFVGIVGLLLDFLMTI